MKLKKEETISVIATRMAVSSATVSRGFQDNPAIRIPGLYSKKQC